jgi:hypothetical protein
MFQICKVFALTAAFSSAITPLALAGSGDILLKDIAGKVLVNHGQSFGPPVQGSNLHEGDRILVGENSAATILFDGCQIHLPPTTVFSIPSKPNCQVGEQTAFVGGVFVQPTAGSTGPVSRVKQLISDYSRQQRMAEAQGNSSVAKCLSGNLTRLNGMQKFLARNPGVDATELIDDVDAKASACQNAPEIAKVRVEKPQIVQPAPPAQIIASAPAAMGGMSGTTLALAGGGAALALGGIGALVLLNNNNNKPISH